jgi:hypothetical protein
LTRKAGAVPTQEEKITVLEENITILLGIASGQERDIKSIQVGVMSLDRRHEPGYLLCMAIYSILPIEIDKRLLAVVSSKQ